MARRYRYRRDTAHHAPAHHSGHSGGRQSALKKYGPWALGAGIIAAIFWPRNASAAGRQNEPAGTTAKVNVTQPPGVKALVQHVEPNLGAAKIQSLPNGTQVTVLQKGITPTDNSGGEWWQIDANGKTGFSRAVDPQNNSNFA